MLRIYLELRTCKIAEIQSQQRIYSNVFLRRQFISPLKLEMYVKVTLPLF